MADGAVNGRVAYATADALSADGFIDVLRRSHEAAGPDTSFVLLSSSQSMACYPKIGLEKLQIRFGVRRTSIDVGQTEIVED